MIDVAGGIIDKNLIPLYAEGSNYIILTYAVNDRQSFEELDFWIENLNSTNIDIILLGNKNDKRREVTLKEGKAKKRELGRKCLHF